MRRLLDGSNIPQGFSYGAFNGGWSFYWRSRERIVRLDLTIKFPWIWMDWDHGHRVEAE